MGPPKEMFQNLNQTERESILPIQIWKVWNYIIEIYHRFKSEQVFEEKVMKFSRSETTKTGSY